MRPRVMFETGALIALERGQHGIRKVHRLAVELGYDMAVTTPVIAEWWRRGRPEKERLRILRTRPSSDPTDSWRGSQEKRSGWSVRGWWMPW